MKILRWSDIACLLVFSIVATAQNSSKSATELNTLAMAAISERNYAAAIQALESASQLEPGNATYYYNLGTVYFFIKDLEKAHFVLLEARSLQPDSVAVLNQIAVVEMEQGRYADALRNLTVAVGMSPQNKVILYNLGCLEIRLQDYVSAIDFLVRAKELGASDPEVHYNLAFAYARAGKLTRSIEEARTTLELSTSDRDARKMLIILYLLNKERSKALAEFHKFELNRAPIDEWLLKVLRRDLAVSVHDLEKP